MCWILLAILVSPAVLPAQGPVASLHVEGKWLRDEAGNNVTLHGVALADLDAIYKGDRNQSLATTVFDIIDKGCADGWHIDVFRLTVHPAVNDETGSHGWLHYDPNDYFTRILDPAVAYAIKKGKYVIVDWHYVGADWRQPVVIASTESFWLGSGSWPGIAAKYANNPNVLFELFNEPGPGTWASWKTQAAKWIDGIRGRGARNVIIVGGPRWSQVLPQSNADLIRGPNIAYACHIYPGHVGVAIPPWIEFTSRAAPVVMTEWGFEKDGPPPVNGTASGYGRKYKAYINAKPNVSWIAWVFDSVYRPVMFDTSWVLLGNGTSTQASRFSGGPDDTPDNYMGQFVKDWLAECAGARATKVTK
jgi:aryl-phospho-beta-D-glucosidase BglC (GH1 family)